MNSSRRGKGSDKYSTLSDEYSDMIGESSLAQDSLQTVRRVQKILLRQTKLMEDVYVINHFLSLFNKTSNTNSSTQ